MARFPSASWATTLLRPLILLTTIIPLIQAASSGDTLQGTNADGITQDLLNSRNPSLYTRDFGDCMGGQSLINVTLFDAAYYADNMTVLFHMGGETNLRDEAVMLVISVWAYGESRFEMVFNPCNANILSLCPLNSSVPISGEAIIPVSTSDVSGIPDIALGIPDFEGSAQLRLFSNSTRTQIGCFQAVMTNGASFSHPNAVGSVLGIFTLVALVASFATAIYGVSVPEIRTHYAHSLSLLVVFEVFQYVFFSGALSLNWPSVLPAFWSNFAWSAGQIYTSSMINSLNGFTGVSGNSSQVGNAGSTTFNNNGGLQQSIYGRSVRRSIPEMFQRGNELAERIYRRADDVSPSKDYSWSGEPERLGLPTAGNWSNFAGTLSEMEIPGADAFLVGFIWFLILVIVLVAVVILFKWSLEAFSSKKWIKEDRLMLFRKNWVHFVLLVVARSILIGFFMMMTLCLFQFSYGGKAGPIVVAVIVFLIFFAGILGLAFYACYYRLQFGRYASSPDRIHFQRKKVLKFLPWYTTVQESHLENEEKGRTAGSVAFFRLHYINHNAERESVHQDENFIQKFGWLSGRFRRTRWWFFAVWVVYQFVRACFVGGARASPTTQVIGLFVVEIIALVGIMCIRPFEGARNTALAVYMLSISKVLTAGLCIAFLPQFSLARIPLTVVAILIIVIQGFLVFGLLILIVLGAVSSYMSLTRNREKFKPQRWQGIRMKYFDNLEKRAPDVPPPPSPPPPPPEEPKEPYFSVSTVRRAPKIEDEDVVPEIPDIHPMASQTSLVNRASRANNLKSIGTVPYGARVHRVSWSSRDFQDLQEISERLKSPYPTTTRNASGHNSVNNSILRAPLVVRTQLSNSNPRPSTPTTPTREQQEQHASERFAQAQ